jgi:hypothetical protein
MDDPLVVAFAFDFEPPLACFKHALVSIPLQARLTTASQVRAQCKPMDRTSVVGVLSLLLYQFCIPR